MPVVFLCLETSTWLLDLWVNILIFFAHCFSFIFLGDFLSFFPVLLNLFFAFMFYLLSLKSGPFQLDLRNKLSLWTSFQVPVG